MFLLNIIYMTVKISIKSFFKEFCRNTSYKRIIRNIIFFI